MEFSSKYTHSKRDLEQATAFDNAKKNYKNQLLAMSFKGKDALYSEEGKYTAGNLVVNVDKKGKVTSASYTGYMEQSYFRKSPYHDKLQGNHDGMNQGYVSEKEARVAKDVAIVTGGVLTIVLSLGTGTPAVLATMSVLSGSMAVAGGGAKLTLDIVGDYSSSDKVPTSYLNATVGAVVEYTITQGDSKTTMYVKGALTITEAHAVAGAFHLQQVSTKH